MPFFRKMRFFGIRSRAILFSALKSSICLRSWSSVELAIRESSREKKLKIRSASQSGRSGMTTFANPWSDLILCAAATPASDYGFSMLEMQRLANG